MDHFINVLVRLVVLFGMEQLDEDACTRLKDRLSVPTSDEMGDFLVQWLCSSSGI